MRFFFILRERKLHGTYERTDEKKTEGMPFYTRTPHSPSVFGACGSARMQIGLLHSGQKATPAHESHAPFSNIDTRQSFDKEAPLV